uniref:Uncharacterized protein n=1 Tax=Colacium vesiculosum TaxID=102910 RepID=I6NJV8_9EUGL|nr:hypothetical protein [Colacium vesiculosum]
MKNQNYKLYFFLAIGIATGMGLSILLYRKKKLLPNIPPTQPTTYKNVIRLLQNSLAELKINKSTNVFIFAVITTFYFINSKLARDREFKNLLTEVKDIVNEIKKILVHEILEEKKSKAPYYWGPSMINEYRQRYGLPPKYGYDGLPNFYNRF